MSTRLGIRVGRRIRGLRRVKGWTQEELGQKAALSRNHVGSIEIGQKIPPLPTIQRICDAFHISLSEFFDFGDAETSKGELISHVSALLRRRSKTEIETANSLLEALFLKNSGSK